MPRPGVSSTGACGDATERRFHQLAAAAGLGLALFMAWTAVAPWIAALASIVILAGSATERLSLTRAAFRWFAAPAIERRGGEEDQRTFLRADALGGTVALGGAVFVAAGVHALGWALVGTVVASLLLDAALDMSPLRRTAETLLTRRG